MQLFQAPGPDMLPPKTALNSPSLSHSKWLVPADSSTACNAPDKFNCFSIYLTPPFFLQKRVLPLTENFVHVGFAARIVPFCTPTDSYSSPFMAASASHTMFALVLALRQTSKSMNHILGCIWLLSAAYRGQQGPLPTTDDRCRLALASAL